MKPIAKHAAGLPMSVTKDKTRDPGKQMFTGTAAPTATKSPGRRGGEAPHAQHTAEHAQRAGHVAAASAGVTATTKGPKAH